MCYFISQLLIWNLFIAWNIDTVFIITISIGIVHKNKNVCHLHTHVVHIVLQLTLDSTDFGGQMFLKILKL